MFNCSICGETLVNNAHKLNCSVINSTRNKIIFNSMYGKYSDAEIAEAINSPIVDEAIRKAYKGGVFPAIKSGDLIDVNSAYPTELTKTPKNIYAVYLDDNESAQVIAIWEKTGALGSVVAGIRAAQNAKGV